MATVADLVVEGEGLVSWYATEEDALAGTNALSVTDVIASGVYYATLTNANGCQSHEAFAVTVEVVLGTDRFDAAAFTYFPNPVKDMLTLSYVTDISSVQVYNMLGQMVLSLQPGTPQVNVNMAGLAQGSYIVNVTAGNASKSIKVVKK
jgi:hypothetical protein